MLAFVLRKETKDLEVPRQLAMKGVQEEVAEMAPQQLATPPAAIVFSFIPFCFQRLRFEDNRPGVERVDGGLGARTEEERPPSRSSELRGLNIQA